MSPGFVNDPTPGTATAVNVVTTAETVAATSPPVNTDGLQTVVSISGVLDVTIGTAGTTLTVKVERGAVAGGTLVTSQGPYTVTAAQRVPIPFAAVDVPGVVVGQLYVVTVTVAAATGNSTVNFASISVTVSTPR